MHGHMNLKKYSFQCSCTTFSESANCFACQPMAPALKVADQRTTKLFRVHSCRSMRYTRCFGGI